ncbi:MAG: hypothetical protein RIQ93_1632 [Verrucomicrobiota bacterium]
MSLANTAIVPAPRDPDDGRFGGQAFIQRHEEFLQIARQEPCRVLFIGDSITDMWREEGRNGVPRGKRVWDSVFAPMRALNFGIGGDRTQHVLWRIDQGELDHLKPKAIVLLIGSNNTGVEHATGKPRNLTPEVIAGVQAVVQSIRAKRPQTKILLLGIFPRGNDEQRKQIREINAAIAPLHDGQYIHYLDIGKQFLLSDGEINRKVMPDRTHPNEAGYEIWAQAIAAPLQALLR